MTIQSEIAAATRRRQQPFGGYPNAQFIYDNVGPRGPVGYAGTPGSTASWTDSRAAGLVDLGTGPTCITIQSPADAVRYQTVFGGGGGTGTALLPYLIDKIDVRHQTGDDGEAILYYDGVGAAFVAADIGLALTGTTGSGVLIGVIADTGTTGRLFINGLTGTFTGTLAGGDTGSVTMTGSQQRLESELFWVDTVTEYHIKVTDSRVECESGSPDDSHVVLTAHDDSTLTFDMVQDFRSTAGAAPAHFELNSGHFIGNLMEVQRIRDYGFKKIGANVTVTLTDCWFNEVRGGHTGSRFFSNEATGGKLTMLRCTYLTPLTSATLVWPNAGMDIALDIQYSKINDQTRSDIDAGLAFLVNLQSYQDGAMVLPKVFYDNEIYMGTGALMTTQLSPDWATVKNMTMEHNYLYGHQLGNKIIQIGPNRNTEGTHPLATYPHFPENIIFRWNKMAKVDNKLIVITGAVTTGPFIVGEEVTWTSNAGSVACHAYIKGIDVVENYRGDNFGTPNLQLIGWQNAVFPNTGIADLSKAGEADADNIVITGVDSGATATTLVIAPLIDAAYNYQRAGNELFDLHRAKNCIVEYNWAYEGGEDFLEHHFQQGGNITRFNGAGHIGDLEYGLHGQIVDYYNAQRNDDLAVGSKCHDTYGVSGGEAMACTHIDEIEVYNILSSNVGEVNGGATNQEIFGLIQLDGAQDTVISLGVSVDAECFAGEDVAEEGGAAGTIQNQVRVAAQMPGPLVHREMLGRFSNLTPNDRNALVQFQKEEVLAGEVWGETEFWIPALSNAADARVGLLGNGSLIDAETPGVAVGAHVPGDPATPSIAGFPTTDTSALATPMALEAMGWLRDFTEECEIMVWFSALTVSNNKHLFGMRSTPPDEAMKFYIEPRNVGAGDVFRAYGMNNNLFDSTAPSPLLAAGQLLGVSTTDQGGDDSDILQDGVSLATSAAGSIVDADFQALKIAFGGIYDSLTGGLHGSLNTVGTVAFCSVGNRATNWPARFVNVRRLMYRLGVAGATWD